MNVFKKLLMLIKLIAYKKNVQTVKMIKPKKPFGKKTTINKKIKQKIFKPGCIWFNHVFCLNPI